MSWSLIPRPKPPFYGPTRCFHGCHTDGEQPQTVNGLCSPGVSRDDAIGAATACDTCRHVHTPALSGAPPELGYRQKPAPPAPPRGQWQHDATGSTYHTDRGEGDE